MVSKFMKIKTRLQFLCIFCMFFANQLSLRPIILRKCLLSVL